MGQAGGPAQYAGLDISPDGKKFAVHLHNSSGGDIWSFDLAEGRMQRLTFDATQDNAMPVWSPDGKRIAFGSKRNNKWGLYVKAADGAAKEELLTESEIPKEPMSWSPDGKLLVYWVNDPKTQGDVWAVPVEGDKKQPIPILQSPSDELYPQVAPDGKWIAYQSNESGHPEIYIKPFPEGPGKWQISTEGGGAPRWRADGKELYFGQTPNIWAVDIRVTGASIDAGVPHALFGLTATPFISHVTSYNVYAVSADGQRFLMPQPPGATIFGGLADGLAQAADQGSGTTNALTNAVSVVLNWPHMLKRGN
jgi:Tol biopolymer transport system component